MSNQTLALNESLSKEVPHLQIAWDSTSLGYLKACPRKYQLRIIEQWSANRNSVALQFGILFHKGMEAYHDALARSVREALPAGDYPGALRAAIRAVLNEFVEVVEAYDHPDGGEAVIHRHQPWESICPKRNIDTLIRALVWHSDNYGCDPARTIVLADGKPAVELSFKLDLPLESPAGERYMLCGHIDRLVEYNDTNWVLDYKTTTMTLGDTYYSQFSPHSQLMLYTLAGGVVYTGKIHGAIVDAVQLAVGFARFGRHLVISTKSQLQEWLQNTICYIAQAERYALSEYWPMNEESCHKWSGCKYRDVCSKTPSMRDEFLSLDFHREVWDPMENR